MLKLSPKMNCKSTKVLVTGADGFIGSHLVEELVRRGHSVRAFVFYNSFNSWGWLDHSAPEIKNSIEVFAGDIRDPYGVRTAMQGCDVVLHLAALIAIPYSYHSPDTYIDTNVKDIQYRSGCSRPLYCESGAHLDQRSLWDRPLCSDYRRTPTPWAVSLFRLENWSRSDSHVILLVLRNPGGHGSPVQYLRAAPVQAGTVIPTIITQIANGERTLKLGRSSPDP